MQLAVDDGELDGRGAAHVVDEGQHLIACLERRVYQLDLDPLALALVPLADDSRVGAVINDAQGQHLSDLVGGLELHPLPARLAVDADADFHLVLGQIEGGLAGHGSSAGGEGHAHAAGVDVDLAA